MAGLSQIDVAEFIGVRPMGRYQVLVFLLCLAVVVFDGYDTQAIGYVAPYMLHDLSLTRADLGPIFSAALIGSALGSLMSGPIADDPPGLRTLRTSDCLNCHAFDARLIGPSFTRIRKRYPYSQATVDSLSRHILEGASGAWSSIKMPSHPELTMEQAAACVTWILKTAADPDTNYYTGTEGTFRVAVPTDSKAKDKGMLVLIASYTDSQRMQGRDAVRLRIQ